MYIKGSEINNMKYRYNESFKGFKLIFCLSRCQLTTSKVLIFVFESQYFIKYITESFLSI